MKIVRTNLEKLNELKNLKEDKTNWTGEQFKPGHHHPLNKTGCCYWLRAPWSDPQSCQLGILE